MHISILVVFVDSSTLELLMTSLRRQTCLIGTTSLLSWMTGEMQASYRGDWAWRTMSQ